MDPEVSKQLSASLIGSHHATMAYINGAFANLAQATGIVAMTSAQAGAAASQFGSDRTAIHVPATDSASNAAKV
jgi:hypothetical protein